METHTQTAQALDPTTRGSLLLMLVTGCPAWAPSFSKLAPFVAENGTLNDRGRAVAEACKNLPIR